MPPYDPTAKIRQYQKQGIKRVKLALTDIDGVLRGKYISLEKFTSLIKGNAGFCSCILGWDVADALYDNAQFTGWHTGFADALFRLIPESERMLPDENVPFFLGEFVASDGKSDHPICPRTLLRRVLDKADSMGYQVLSSAEYEFFVFSESPHSVREKGYRNLTPLSPGMFGYSTIRNSVHSDLFNALQDYCLELNIPIEGLHCETGPGVWEAAITYDDALASADKAALFKTFTKVFFQKRNAMATFMAKWSMDFPGQSGHIHQSLVSKRNGKPVFYDAKKEHGMSHLMRQFIAGQQKYLKAFLPLIAPTVNDYTRLVKGAWAPTAATWGVENRTVALRAITGGPKSQRVETRVASADGNPYLAMAASIGAGLLGLEEELELGAPVVGNAYEVGDKLPQQLQFAGNLRDALEPLKKSKEARALFGSEFVEHFLCSREWEVREYEKTVTDWQLKRYFEII